MTGGHIQLQEGAVPDEFKARVHCESRVAVAMAEEGECPQLIAVTGGLVKDSKPRRLCMCSELRTVRTGYSADSEVYLRIVVIQ
jgi:hypothetical protein